MDWLINLPPAWREYFLGADGASEGLVAQFVSGLLSTARRQVRERFRSSEQTRALQKAVGTTSDTALNGWTIEDEKAVHHRDLFHDWLLNPAVLYEFRTLLAPDNDNTLDLDRLREKFEDTGLDAPRLGAASFDVLVKDMVGAFYFAAAREPTLHESLKIELLLQLAERTGALDRLAQQQVAVGEHPVDLLAQIRHFAEQVPNGQVNTNELLRKISQVLTDARQHGSGERMLAVYQQSELALNRVGLPTNSSSPEMRIRLREILAGRFSESELKDLCSDLSIDHENFEVRGKANLARELLAYCERYKRTSDLIREAMRLRPDIDWASLVDGTTGRSAPSGAYEQVMPALAPILTMLSDIHTRLTAKDSEQSRQDLAALEAHYRQTIIDQFEKLTFKGLSPSGTPIVLPLEQVYVELKAVADVPEAADTYSADERRLLLEAEGRGEEVRAELALHLDALRAERWNRQTRQEMMRLQRRSIQDTLDDSTQRSIVILGDPGSGKTTLLHYQALRAARGSGSTGSAAIILPIFVPLAAYDDFLRREPEDHSLGSFLAIYYDQWHSLPGLAPLFHQVLMEGRALVLLDGLDEVLGTTTRQFVAEQAGALIREWTPQGNRFAITSRIVGYREAHVPGNPPHVTVLDFGRTEIEIFAHQWCRSYEAWVAGAENTTVLQRAATEERALLDDVRGNPSVERLAASPLLLTMLALLRRHVGKLPDRRVELYERYVRTLIDNWEDTRSSGARQQAPERFDPHTAIAHLIELAYWLQQYKPSGTARRQELEQELERICLRFEGHDLGTAPLKARVQAQQVSERFLRDMRHFAGLLAERGRDAFGFLHLTFQEYFCGRALARMDADTCWAAISPNLHRPRWREPILLCAGQLGVVEQRRDRASDLARRILEVKSPHEPILHRDLFLAATLAADNVGLSNTVLDKIAEGLAALQTSPISTVRDTALRGLAQLSRLGYAPALTALQDSLRNTALHWHVMSAAKGVIGAEACAPLRQAIEARLADESYNVRQAAVEALAPLVASDAAARQAIEAQLADESYDVRQAAVEALAPLVTKDNHLKARLVPWLGTVSEVSGSSSRTQQLLAGVYASLLASDPGLLAQVANMLRSPAWPTRQGAAWALIAMPGGPPPHLLPILHSLLDDFRVEESWPGRLQASALLINDRNTVLSQRAVVVAMEALDYATQPRYNLPHTGPYVRQQAAGILGQLEPLYRDEAVFARLARVLEEDEDGWVRDAAYGALLRLAAAPEAAPTELH